MTSVSATLLLASTLATQNVVPLRDTEYHPQLPSHLQPPQVAGTNVMLKIF